MRRGALKTPADGTSIATPDSPGPSLLGVIAAFAAVYIIWGSTYLAIRFAVEALPPLLMAGTRFLVAGSVLYAWSRRRGAAKPIRTHWRSAAVVGTLLLLGGNGSVCWAERTIPSGMAALIVTTVPLWMALLEALRPGGQRPSRWDVLGLILGFAGVYILVDPGRDMDARSLNVAGVLILLFASLSWATGSLYSRHAKLPDSPLLAAAMEMLAGGAALVVVGLAMGEGGALNWKMLTPASMTALAYLILFGSIVGFTSYMWLLRVSTPSRVGTYAFVNPAVAVVLGWAMADEVISPRILLAMVVILTSVALITQTKRPADMTPRRAGDHS